MEGHDLLGIAQTGTGRTAAFALPMLNAIQDKGLRAAKKRPLALILAPTRELASQIFEDIRQYSQETSIRATCIFGGANQNPQIRRLEKGAEILVATPGRLMDLEAQGFLSLSAVQYLVLDEADRLLDMGFIGDIRKIAAMLPGNRQTALFSATMSKEIRALSAFLLNQPQQVSVTPKQVAVAKITQHKLAVPTAKKQEALHQLLNRDAVRKVIVFTRTKHASERVTKKLLKAGFSASAINGNKSQNARTRALERFKKGSDWILVATDVAARGIDIRGISHVINFELPQEPENYVHRIGRTARAGETGVAWSLVYETEAKRLKEIERLMKQPIPPLSFDLKESPPSEDQPTPEPAPRQNQSAPAPDPAKKDKGTDDRKRRRPRRRKPNQSSLGQPKKADARRKPRRRKPKKVSQGG